MHLLTLTNFEQLLINGVISGTAYGLLGVSFGLILGTTGRFHFAFVFTYALSAYMAAQVGSWFNAPFWLALIIGAAVGTIFGVLMEALIYRRLSLRSGAYALLIIFVASLGLAIAGENIISLIWNKSASLQISGVDISGITIGPVDFTNLNVEMVVVSWALIVLLGLMLAYTKLGREMRAVRVNPEMSLVVGINPAVIYLIVFAIGSFLGGVGAVFTAANTAATPDMGFRPIFYAFVVAFLAGAGRPPVVTALVGVGVGLVESLSGLFLSTQWSSLVVFTMLFIYVALRPVDLRAKLMRLMPSGSVPAQQSA
ncbi:MAG TPA: branched-chain amino acid ABC transporter permease [Acidimicrobiales bacterium]|nr:branched-chain amino acid ABC transporter permease [Acidimicrobiales bacterium]